MLHFCDHADDELWDTMCLLYKNAADPQRKPQILFNAQQMCCSMMPKACLNRWEDTKGICNPDEKTCMRPSCMQLSQYLSEAQPHISEVFRKANNGDALEDEFRKCTFVTADEKCQEAPIGEDSSAMQKFVHGEDYQWVSKQAAQKVAKEMEKVASMMQASMKSRAGKKTKTTSSVDQATRSKGSNTSDCNGEDCEGAA